jgi:G3E family GTPase
MRTPLAVVTGVDPAVMDRAMLSLSWDLPQAVAARHRIDPDSQVLTRTVSDATGVLEHEEIPLEHACVSCALREDILPTLQRLAQDGRWSTIVSCLPGGTEADQLAHAVSRDARLARHLRLSCLISTLAAERLVDDLLGDDLLRERHWHTNPDDDRGVGEVACAQVERADVVVVDAEADGEGLDLVRALARPDTLVVHGTDQLDGNGLSELRHEHTRTTAWCSPLRDDDLPPLGDSRAWRLDLRSERALHPDRMLDQIERLGGGPHRSRGCFWVPTRPGLVQQWDGAGGQLSIGHHGTWGRRTPFTRLMLTGLGARPTDLVAAFDELLVTPDEDRPDRGAWRVLEDGLEPWLGDIRDIA